MAFFGFGKKETKADPASQEAENRSGSAESGQEGEEKEGVFRRFWKGLSKSRTQVSGQMDELVRETEVIDEDFYESLLDILIMSDIGVRTAENVIATLRGRVAEKRIESAGEARRELKSILKDMVSLPHEPLSWPMVMLIVGVNGVGKTTTIGKLALRFKNARHSVVLVAADTFRAAAADQLAIWADRAGVPLVRHNEGADPAAVVYDGVQKAKAIEADLLIVDTAGRLHNKKNLMEELRKIRKLLDREYPEAAIRPLLVLDATTGQNGLNQAKEFAEVTDLYGIVLTKLDGTAKGGIAIAITNEMKLPVLYVGMGEGIEDLQSFDADAFIDAIF